jgi:hypothetical protein
MASMGAGHHVPPHSLAYAGPNRVDTGGNASHVPLRLPGCHGDHPAAAGNAVAPRGARARRAKRGSRDKADRARLGPAAGS